MALNLDARQRAMLQDMGITLWIPPTPAPAPVAAPVTAATAAPAPSAPIADASTAVRHSAAPVAEAVAVPAAAVVAAPSVAPPPAPAVETKIYVGNQASKPAASAQTAPDSEASSLATDAATPAAHAAPLYRAPAAASAPWFMAPLVHAYADTAQATAPDAGWLVLVECADPQAPWAGDAGQLLNNMLRALRLQLHPQVRIAPLTRQAPAEGANDDLQPLAPALQAALTEHRPARVLVLGLHAARAVLQRTEALGPLRAEVHQLHGVPTVVSYDPAYLLRAAHAKPGAWADLCRAQGLAAAAQTD